MIRPMDPERDIDAVLRIYREVGWVPEKAHESAARELMACGRGWVEAAAGSPECFVATCPGTVRYADRDLPLCAVTSVITSRIARKQGLAGRLTAHALADAAQRGEAVAMLGMFEQGFYDQLGFGTGVYEHTCTFDPATLRVPARAAIPVRLEAGDWQAMHAGRLRRVQGHGACSLTPAGMTHCEVLWSENGFGLGYMNADGEVSHHMWCSAKGEHGPYRVEWMAYETRAQFLELLALVRSLGEQVHSIRMHEPAGIQLQDFLKTPFRWRRLTDRSPHEHRMTASAYWQLRILDLTTCVAAMQLACDPIRFNLVLSDPVSDYLSNDSDWRGIAGEYTVVLGPESSVTSGKTADLPTLQTTVNAFSRLWFGVRSATSLSWSDELRAPDALLRALDNAVCLPAPVQEWDF